MLPVSNIKGNILICALGNPGDKYCKTRHNIGFIFADSVSKFFKFSPFFYCKKIKGDISAGSIAGRAVLILKPDTYMNRSGVAVQAAMKAFTITGDNLFVVHDDVDIEFSFQRLKSGGGDGGHNGIKSIVSEIGTNNFHRIRIGIGKPKEKAKLEEYVLSNFLDDEEAIIDNTLSSRWNDILNKTINDGVTQAMTIFNRRNS